MEFLVIYLGALVIPGALLSWIFKVHVAYVGLAIAWSVTIAVLGIFVADTAGIGWQGFQYLLFVVYAVIFIVALPSLKTQWRTFAKVTWLSPSSLIPVTSLVVVAGYASWAGPYMEVPADAWWHIGQIKERLEDFSNGEFGWIDQPEDIFRGTTGYWYTLNAFLISLSGTELEAALYQLAVANTILFCMGVYFFAVFVFKRVGVGECTRHYMAAASMFFFVTHFGISVFSYVRYYIYAPTIVNYVLYLSAVACVLTFVERGLRDYRPLAAAMMFFIVAAMVHTQEAVFIAAMCGAMLLILAWMRVRKEWAEGAKGVFVRTEVETTRLLVVLGVIVLAYGVIHGFLYATFARSDPLAHGVMADIRNYVPFLQNLYVLRPTGQFYQVLTAWGVLVYLGFFIYKGELSASPYLAAGMAIPVLTVFNPIFTDLFLRVATPQTLWRMSYMIPLAFVGGYLLIRVSGWALYGDGTLKRLAGLTVMATMIALLFPIRTVFFVAPNSKIYTLRPVAKENDHRYWYDLIRFLRERPKSGIITDPVTGYVVNGLTDHKYRGYKFYDKYASHIRLESYKSEEFQAQDGWKNLVTYQDFKVKKPWLVVVNQRDGGTSLVGRYGRHWGEDIMKVSKRYSRAFIEYVEGSPDMFKEAWKRDRIVVYEVSG